jgi:hypothetical protein
MSKTSITLESERCSASATPSINRRILESMDIVMMLLISVVIVITVKRRPGATGFEKVFATHWLETASSLGQDCEMLYILDMFLVNRSPRFGQFRLFCRVHLESGLLENFQGDSRGNFLLATQNQQLLTFSRTSGSIVVTYKLCQLGKPNGSVSFTSREYPFF